MLLGYVHKENGNLNMYWDKPVDAIESFMTSFSKLDIRTKHYLISGELPIVALNFINNGELEKAKQTFDTGDKVLAVYHHKYNYGINERLKAYLACVEKDYVKAHALLKNSFIYNLRVKSMRQSMFYHEDLGKTYLYEGKHDFAMKHLKIANRLDLAIRPNIPVSRAELYILFLQAKDLYKESLQRFEIIQKQNLHNYKAGQVEYVQACTEYIYARTEEEELKGKIHLQEIIANPPYEIIRIAAKNTLIEKKIQPIY